VSDELFYKKAGQLLTDAGPSDAINYSKSEASDFSLFAARRAELKSLFRENLFLIKD
jgi:hypothetical protein